MATPEDGTKERRRDSRQQAVLWQQQAGLACLQRRFISAIRYYRQALDLARAQGLAEIHGPICRDLAYLYLHHGDVNNARRLLAEGLAIEDSDPVVRLGLLCNMISVHLAEQQYCAALATLDRAFDICPSAFPEGSRTSSIAGASTAGLLSLRRQVGRVMDLLQAGIDPRRLQIEFRLALPPWERGAGGR